MRKDLSRRAPLTGVFLLANGLVLVRSDAAVFPRWLGWAALLFGVAAFTPFGWISLAFVLALWSLIVSMLMCVRQGAPAAAAAAATGRRTRSLGAGGAHGPPGITRSEPCVSSFTHRGPMSRVSPNT